MTMELGVPLDGSRRSDALETDPDDAAQDLPLEPRAPVRRARRGESADRRRRARSTSSSIGTRRSTASRTSLTSTTRRRGERGDRAASELRAPHALRRTSRAPDPTVSYRRGWRRRMSQRLARRRRRRARRSTATRRGARARAPVPPDYDASYHVSLLTSVQLEGRCSEPASRRETAAGQLPDATRRRARRCRR